MSTLGILWFILIAVLIIGYFALDGFDLGIGVLYLSLCKTEEEAAIARRAVGPLWDGNEVWILTAGGALFAAFSPAFATAFSGFYLAIMLVLFGLILRAVSLEYRAHGEGPLALWDVLFCVGSLLPALLLGVAMGNIIAGLPLNAHGDYIGGFFALLNPFALLCGVLGLMHMLMQGCAWLAAKAPEDSELRLRAATWRRYFAVADLIAFVLVSIVFFAFVSPASAVGIGATPLAVLFVVVYVVSTLAVAFRIRGYAADDPLAPVFAGLGCVGLVGTFAASMFPYVIPATVADLSLTIANSANSDVCLGAMTVIALIGVPLVLIYHVVVYRTFRGRVKPEDLAE
jgi:cytochrome d ubiquinol oxidase subunit II